MTDDKAKTFGRPANVKGVDYPLRDIPPEDWKRFKAACKAKGLTARFVLIGFIQSFPAHDDIPTTDDIPAAATSTT